MNNHFKRVSLGDAVAGMVLSEAVLDSGGAVLLPAASALTEAMLASLRRRGIEFLFVVDDEVSEAQRKEAFEHAMYRLAVLFRKSGSGEACAMLRQCVSEYRMGDPG